jgi:hypothetical protein
MQAPSSHWNSLAEHDATETQWVSKWYTDQSPHDIVPHMYWPWPWTKSKEISYAAGKISRGKKYGSLDARTTIYLLKDRRSSFILVSIIGEKSNFIQFLDKQNEKSPKGRPQRFDYFTAAFRPYNSFICDIPEHSTHLNTASRHCCHHNRSVHHKRATPRYSGCYRNETPRTPPRFGWYFDKMPRRCGLSNRTPRHTHMLNRCNPLNRSWTDSPYRLRGVEVVTNKKIAGQNDILREQMMSWGIEHCW